MTDQLQPECPYVTGTVTRYCTLTPFTLTDEEREAIGWAIAATAGVSLRAETMRGLLERTRNGAVDGCETDAVRKTRI
jgi:hypothetical protein